MNLYGVARCLLVAAMALPEAAPATSVPGSGLKNTPHDFMATSNTDPATPAAATGGLCTFCHTPHVVGNTRLLWNHTLSKNVFDYGAATTTAGTPYARFSGDSYRGPSAKCLSCHDGSVAAGDVGTVTQGSRQVGANGNLAGTHPVAMPYPFGKAANTYNGITNGARMATAEWVADPTRNNIRLYSDDGLGNIDGVPRAGAAGIECSSCHDPHNKASNEAMFLRGKLTGATRESGYLCAQCHNKN
jgi:hypothetical protein